MAALVVTGIAGPSASGGRRATVYGKADLQRVLAPSSIAVLGGFGSAAAFGSRVLANCGSFAGPVYPISAKRAEVAGHKTYPSLSDLPSPPDCVIVALPKAGVEAAVRDAAAAGAGGVVIFAAGYVETGDGAAQARLAAIARDSGLRVIGPNCIGVVNHGLGLGGTFSATAPHWYVDPHPLVPVETLRRIGLVSQSGGLGTTLALAARRGVAFSHLLTSGNSCDVDVADLIGYLVDDPACHAIACLFEGMPDPLRFLAAAERAWAADKPLVVYKIATGESGAAAALSHSGSMAGSNAAYQAMFDRGGVVVVDKLEALIETASFFAKAPPMRARGVAISTSSGGLGVMAADKADLHGIALPQPGAATLAALSGVMPDFVAVRNPCDVTGAVANDPGMMEAVEGTLLADPDYGALVGMIPLPWNLEDRVRSVAALARRHGKPICDVWASEWLEAPGAAVLEMNPAGAVFRSIDRCFATLAAWHRREERRGGGTGDGSAPPVSDGDREEAGRLLRADPAPILTESASKAILARYGIGTVGERLCATAEEAVLAAVALGFPVALKIESPHIAHKTEAGVVRLGLADAAAVREAFAETMANARRSAPGARINGALVQPMVPSGLELIVGARRDPLFGPLVMIGLGGVMVELIKDMAVDLAPVTRGQALAMLARLKGDALLDGFRGAAPVDRAAVADVIRRVSLLAADHEGAIEEIDVNPLICSGGRITAVDALIVRSGGGRFGEDGR